MIDPITAITIATKAFNTVKAMVAAGKEVEDTLGQIGVWYGACSDFNEAKKQAENPPLFKKIINSKSVEQEAMEIYAKEKKMLQQEKDLRQLLLYTYGQGGYQELVDLRRKIKEQREKTVYAQARRRKAFIWNTAAVGFISITVAVFYALVAAILNKV